MSPNSSTTTAVAEHAERVTARVDLTGANHFTAKRLTIREALTAEDITAEIEALVDALLPT